MIVISFHSFPAALCSHQLPVIHKPQQLHLDMATSQQWRQASLMVAATLAVLFIGSADAWCKAGYRDCDYNPKNGCETNVMGSDVKNCGDCGKSCETYPNVITKCNGGKCDYSCKPGWANCDGNWKNGCEKDVTKDLFNCGSCGNCCASYPNVITKCNGGKCEYPCKTGWANCDGNLKNGCEKDVTKDIYNCGGCGKTCPKPTYKFGEATCSNGVCGQQCKKGMKYDSYKKCCVPSY